MIKFLCRKIGTIQKYDKNGYCRPMTILSVYNCYILKTLKLNNKFYLILSYFFYNLNKKNIIMQYNINNFEYNNFKVLNNIPLNILYINQKINITSISIGKGFSGTIKRHNFKSNYATHGNSKAHNKPGSIGMCQDPGRVFKGKKMAGRLGGKKVTVSNSKILDIDFHNRLFYISTSVPSFNNANIIISSKS